MVYNGDDERGQLLGELICQGELHPLYDGNNIIGTVISRCDITINDKSISDFHAVIKIDRNTIFLTDLRSSAGTFIGQRGTWKRVNRRDFLVESSSNLRFGSIDCSLRFPVAGSGNRDCDESSRSSAMARRSEEIETQAMDENFLMLPPTGHNSSSSSSSSSSYRAMIASAVTQVLDTSLVDELGDDTIDDGDKEAEVGNCNGNGLQASDEDLLGDETHSEATLTSPQSPSHTNFPAPEAAVTLASLPLDVVEVDDDGSSQESADLFHVDVAIADTLVDDDLEDEAAVVDENDAPERTVSLPTALAIGKKRSRLDEESSDDNDDDGDGRGGGNKSALLEEQDATMTLVGELPTQIIDIVMPDDLMEQVGEDGEGNDGGGSGGSGDGIVVAGPVYDPSSPPNQQRLTINSTPPEPIVSPLLRLPDLETVSVPLDVAAVPVAEEASPIRDSISASGPQKKKRNKKDSSQSVPATKSRKGKQLLQEEEEEEIEREAEDGAIEMSVTVDQVAEIVTVTESAVPAAVAVVDPPASSTAKKAVSKKSAGKRGKACATTVSVLENDVEVSLPNAIEAGSVPEAVVAPVVVPSDPAIGIVGVGKRGSRAAMGSKNNAETAASVSSSSSSRRKKPVPVEEIADQEQMKSGADQPEQADAVTAVATLKKRGRAAAAAATTSAEKIPSPSVEEGPPQKQIKASRVRPVKDQSIGEVVMERDPEKGAGSVRFTSPVVDKLVEFSPMVESSAKSNNPVPAGRRARRNDPSSSSPSSSSSAVTAIEPPSPLSQSFALSPRTVANTLINQGVSGGMIEEKNEETEITDVSKKRKKGIAAKNQALFPASPLPVSTPAPSSSSKAAPIGPVAAESAVRILFTALPEEVISKEDAELMAGKIAGAVVVEDPIQASHIILGDDLKRTPNLLVALNSGAKYVLYLSWLRDSSKKGIPLPIPSLAKSKYIVRDKKKEALWGFSMDHTLSLPRSREAGVFSGYGFHYQVEGVTSVPPPDKMRAIIESGGGRWVQNLQCGEAVLSAEVLSVLVVTCPEAIQKAQLPFRQLLAQLMEPDSVALTYSTQISGDGSDATGLGKKKKAAGDEKVTGVHVVGVFAVEAVLLAALRQELDLTESPNSHRIDLRALMPGNNSNATSNGTKNRKGKDKNRQT